MRKALCLAIIAAILFVSGCGGDGGGKPQPTGVQKNYDYLFEYQSGLQSGAPEYYPEAGDGTVYYVSTAGSDSNDGKSPEKPLKTINKVNNLALNPGDTVLFKRGDTFFGTTLLINYSGEDGNPVTYASYGEGKQKPRIITSKKTAVSAQNVSNIVLRDLEVSVNADNRITQDTISYPCIRFDYTPVDGAASEYKNIYICDNTIYANDIKSATQGIRINFDAFDGDTFGTVLTNSCITGNTVYDVGVTGISYNTWKIYKDISKGHVQLSQNIFKNALIERNRVYNTGNMGIYMCSVTDSAINRNEVHDTGLFDRNFENIGACGIMAICAKNTEIKYNVVYNVEDAQYGYDAMGIDIDWLTENVDVQYNYTYDCKGAGISTMANYNSIIRNNKVENNRCEGTNQHAQIQITDFTMRHDEIDEKYYGVRGLRIYQNLIINDKHGKSLFGALQHADSTLETDKWTDNTFYDNRMVNVTGNDENFIYITDVLWQDFYSNKYYNHTAGVFNCVDPTPYEEIFKGEGRQNAEQYVADGTFASWNRRDLNSTLELLNDAKPSKVSNVKCGYLNGRITLQWDAASGDVWHYNVYLTDGKEAASYLNMLGETASAQFEHVFAYKGEYYLVIEAETNQGICGGQVVIKIVL